MSKFKIADLPGGEIIISRIAIEKEDGFDCYDQFMLRDNEQIQLIDWLLKNRYDQIITEQQKESG